MPATSALRMRSSKLPNRFGDLIPIHLNGSWAKVATDMALKSQSYYLNFNIYPNRIQHCLPL